MINEKVLTFVVETMKNWIADWTAGRNCLAEVKIQLVILQVYSLSPLLFVSEMMPFNHILRKCTSGYKLTKSQENIYQLMYIIDIKWLAKKEKILKS